MKTRMLFLIGYLLAAVPSWTQNRNTVSASGIGTLEYLNPLSAPVLSFDNRFSGTHGSPYYVNDFRSATLIINKNDTIRGVAARLQLTEPYVEVQINGQVQGQISFDNLQQLTLERTDGSTDKFVTQQIDDQTELLAVLHSGTIKMYQRLRKRLLKADYGGSHSVDKRYDEYVDLYQLYLADEQGVLHKAKLRAKDFIQVLPQHKSVIKDFFRSNIIKTTDDVLPLLEQLG